MLGHYGHEQKISGRLSGGASIAVSYTSDDGRDGVPGSDICSRHLRLTGTRENTEREMDRERKV